MHALIIDDTPAIRTLFSITLELEGWTVDAAADGPAGLAAIEEHIPDVVFLDLMMPGMSGHNVLQHLIQIPQMKPVPRIIVSARDTPFDRELAFGLGACAYLTKPVDPDRIVAAAWDFTSDQPTPTHG